MNDPQSGFVAQACQWLTVHRNEFGRQARRGLSESEDLALARRWQRMKYDAGYAGIAWPRAHGGQGLSPIEKLAFEQEEARLGFPTEYFAISLGMPVPIVLRYLPDGWKQERAHAALRGDEIWCQLFSEPGAGSDLAGVRTRARRDGDDWVISGQKLWTSWAQYADYGVILVRTDPSLPKHKGLSYFWIDMRAPGVEVRPIKLADGGHDVNEVFFSDLRIPDSQRIGAVGGGFGVAMETLVIERYSAADPAGFGPPLSLLVEQFAARSLGDGPALSDGRVRREIARAHATQYGLSEIYQRALLGLAEGQEPGPEGAIHKLVSMRTRQLLAEFALDVFGAEGMAWDPDASEKDDWARSWLAAPTGRMAGGADEMLLNTIAEKLLGLPQDHRPDKGVPFDATGQGTA